ncbi:MAG: hypothetical protein ABI837_06580, partial [Acidobacteriota bacterium]
MTGRAIVTHVDAPPEEILRAIASERGEWTWMFLGSQYRAMLRWREAIAGEASQTPVARSLHACATRLRRPFLELISRLGRERQSLAWWTSRLAERSPFMSPLFLRCCYVRVALDLSGERTVIVAESAALLAVVAES